MFAWFTVTYGRTFLRLPRARFNAPSEHLPTLGPQGADGPAPDRDVFIARRDGRRHGPEEWAEPAHLAAGSRVLLEPVLRLTAALAEPSLTL
jgi:hypothetical protein